jgi:hypothetical protein
MKTFIQPFDQTGSQDNFGPGLGDIELCSQNRRSHASIIYTTRQLHFGNYLSRSKLIEEVKVRSTHPMLAYPSRVG